ncbi:hypothetical protein [Nesterenkonia flava]|uniref:DUF11 domain-containing protein n=1 Tax=Nesterenkonia flava TaxID=469799 RepID=A0ABU1FVY0_9MICC|nr:hypothetical protein [Nesterenkonia flava]MDR5712487.1 hypothetical protein [Nesterenkonia flava]
MYLVLLVLAGALVGAGAVAVLALMAVLGDDDQREGASAASDAQPRAERGDDGDSAAAAEEPEVSVEDPTSAGALELEFGRLGSGAVSPGEELIYEIRVDNQGPDDQPNTFLSATFPPGFEFIPDPVVGEVLGHEWTAELGIESGELVIIHLHVHAPSSLAEGLVQVDQEARPPHADLGVTACTALGRGQEAVECVTAWDAWDPQVGSS